MSAAIGGGPVPPPLPTRRSAQPPPTQVEFLLSQVRATLGYLSEIGGFDPVIKRQIHELLIKGTIDTNLTASHSATPTYSKCPITEAETESLGKKNSWLRKALSETSILPTAVETALSLTAGPLLSDEQKDAIVQLVEFSQKGVAEKLTDPTMQRRTATGAKTAPSSAIKAVSGWSRGLKEGKEKKISESGEKRERKKREKEEKKQIKEELKREREEVIRSRQRQMLNSDEGRRGSEDLVASPTSTVSLIRNSRDGLVSAHQNLASLRSEAEDGGASSSTDSDESRHQYVRITNQGPINANKWESGSGSIADAATLTVLSDAISTRQNGARSSVGGTNTTFVVEPGLAISCSLVVVKGEKELGEELQAAGQHNVASLTSMSSKSDIAVPPPPPTHPEVLGIRRQSSSAAPFIRTPSISGLDPSRGVD